MAFFTQYDEDRIPLRKKPQFKEKVVEVLNWLFSLVIRLNQFVVWVEGKENDFATRLSDQIGKIADLDDLAVINASIAADAFDKTPFNMLKDGGALINETDAPFGTPVFNKGVLLGSVNGSVITEHSRFIHNNSTYGGLESALDPILAEMTNQRYGKIWCAANIASGTGTSAPITKNGETFYFANHSPHRQPGNSTLGFSIRAIDNNINVKGVVAGVFDYHTIKPQDGVVFVQRSVAENVGYSNYPNIRMKPNSNCVIAKLQLVSGIHTLTESETS